MKTYSLEAGIAHYRKMEHDSTNCAPCELRAQNLQWLKDNPYPKYKKAKR